KTVLASATLVLLAALALIAAMGCPSHAGGGQPASSEGAAPKTVTVEIREFKFEPATLTVHQGEAVEWKNDDAVSHTATVDAAQKPTFDSGDIQAGAEW